MQRLRIGVSARGLNSYASGPNEYIYGLSNELVHQAAGKHHVFLYYNTPRLVGTFPSAVERVVPNTSTFLWDHIALPFALRRDQPDLILYPKGTIPLWSPGRKVPIMLDLGYFHPALNAYKAGNTLYMRQAMKYAARKAWLVLTISEFTRQDVIRLLGVAPGQVHNIYGAASERYRRVSDAALLEAVRRKHGLSQPFIFYPASVSPRKNFPRILQAFERIQDKIPHHLYFTGHVAWNSSGLETQFRRLSERVHRLGATPAEDMAAIYSLAQFAIYPSLFEGLGLPMLEAFQCGTPLMASDQSSIPEVAGEAALIVNAYDVDSIAGGFLKMALDEGLRKSLVAAGYERVRHFTWERTVSTLLKVVEENWQL